MAMRICGRYNLAQQRKDEGGMGTVLKNVQPIGGSPPVDIRIEGARIAAISDVEIAPRSGDDVIDGGGKLVVPGFVNAHTHLAMVLFRGLADDVPLETWLEAHVWPIEAKLRPEDVYWCTLLAVAEGIRGGTTAFADMYFHTDEVGRALEESGARALVSYGIIAPAMGEKGRAEIEEATRVIERWSDAANGRIRAAISPHSVYTCGEDVWRAAIDVAADRGVPIHTHLAETRHEVDAWREKTGVSEVSYLEELGAFAVPVLAAHCVHVDGADIEILADHDVTVAHCPKSNAKLGSGIAPVNTMREAGIRVAIGTDGAASNNRLDMIEEMRTAWILQRARHEDPMRPSAEGVLDMATSAGRRILGLEPEGWVEGARADLVLIDREPLHAVPQHDPLATLVFASSALDVTDVLVDGRWLMRDRELRTIDVERVRFEVEGLRRRYGH
jgi:5-methylthioadenosine/S-adenosylhomocysteine deaminase